MEGYIKHSWTGDLPHKLGLNPKKEMKQKYQEIIYDLANKDFQLFGYDFI